MKSSRSSSLPRRTTVGATSPSGDRSCAIDLADAITTFGARPSAIRHRSNARSAMDWLSGLTRSSGWVSQAGHSATSSPSPSSAATASRNASASFEVAVTQIVKSLARA